jgi:hypothetical protein
MSRLYEIGVVAHTARASMAKTLARQVGARFVGIDNGLLGCEGNHMAVLHHLAGLRGVWSVALEDDAVPVDGFADQLRMVLESAPADVDVVSLYLGRQRPPQFQRLISVRIGVADRVGAHWLTSSRLLHAVGYAIRTDLIPGLLEFDSSLPIDERIGAYVNRVGYCWPSLVDHADLPTLVGHPDGKPRPPGRTAWRTGTRAAWSDASIELTN